MRVCMQSAVFFELCYMLARDNQIGNLGAHLRPVLSVMLKVKSGHAERVMLKTLSEQLVSGSSLILHPSSYKMQSVSSQSLPTVPGLFLLGPSLLVLYRVTNPLVVYGLSEPFEITSFSENSCLARSAFLDLCLLISSDLASSYSLGHMIFMNKTFKGQMFFCDDSM